MSNFNEEQFKKLGRIFNADKIVSVEDLAEVLKAITQIMNSFKKDNVDLNLQTKEIINSTYRKIKSEIEESIISMNSIKKESEESNKSTQSKTIKTLEDLIKSFNKTKPKDGKTPKKGVDYFDGEDGDDGSPDTAVQVRDKLETLKKGNKLSISAIEDLSDLLEEISKKLTEASSGKPNKVGGGTRLIRFIDDFTPIGDLDGINTIFKLPKTPATNSLKVYRGGARQRVTEDYTFDGYRTITFLVPPELGEIILVDFRY